ncbi:zinc-binding dehydrogenase [Mangrovicoccus ximenensis]|uniref:zinc-binding dehydrogenase n=1 Tax=Mangrovicoccus ximenensis TaxID=1911570 RepID=UPI00137519DD|nr:zinc-binding dehydrogenase [Mangrovicoccus ximenensis]
MLGAEVVPRSDDFAGAVRAACPGGADALLDTALLGEAAFGALRQGGIYIPVRGWPDAQSETRVTVRPVMVPEVLERTDWLEELAAAASRGIIAPRVHSVHAPEEAAEAQRLLLAGGMRGRPVIVF